MTCSIIYWSIVVHIVTFGSEIWCLSETDHEKLISFQIHIGKHIQRFPPSALNCCSFYDLGWMRLATYILVKKMLFAMTILRLKDDSLIKQVFKERSKFFKISIETATENVHNRPDYEILKTVLRMGVFNILYDMCTGAKDPLSNRKWSSYIQYGKRRG